MPKIDLVTLGLVRDLGSGDSIVALAAQPSLASFGEEENALLEAKMFLMEYLAKAEPETALRFALPEGTTLHTLDVLVPRTDLPRRWNVDTPIRVSCLVIPTVPNTKGQRDRWVMVVPLGHTFFATAIEDLDEEITTEVKRLVRHLGALERGMAFPGKALRFLDWLATDVHGALDRAASTAEGSEPVRTFFPRDVSAAYARYSGIPLTLLSDDISASAEDLAGLLKARVIGQDEACNACGRVLAPADVERIVGLELAATAKRTGFVRRNLRLYATPAAQSRLAELGYHPTRGARPLRRLIEERVVTPIAARIAGDPRFRDTRVAVYASGEEQPAAGFGVRID
ncbi:MAG: hypothetical protein FWD73_01775 [Polyangiaceae bacterium]|nr:hypothetical protein [Polyangiaceae bacterium]